MNHRTAAIEACVRAPGSRPDVPAHLVQDITARFRYWQREHTAPLRRFLIVHPLDPLPARFSKALLWIAITAAVGAVLSGAWTMIVMFGIVLALLVTIGMLDRQRHAHLAPHHARSCSACYYDLSGCEPAIPAAAIGGLWIGPRRCPECGAAWPILPPPAPRPGRP